MPSVAEFGEDVLGTSVQNQLARLNRGSELTIDSLNANGMLAWRSCRISRFWPVR